MKRQPIHSKKPVNWLLPKCNPGKWPSKNPTLSPKSLEHIVKEVAAVVLLKKYTKTYLSVLPQ